MDPFCRSSQGSLALVSSHQALSPVLELSALPGLRPPSSCMGGCQNYGPLLGPLNTRCRIRKRTKKGAMILTTYTPRSLGTGGGLGSPIRPIRIIKDYQGVLEPSRLLGPIGVYLALIGSLPPEPRPPLGRRTSAFFRATAFL